MEHLLASLSVNSLANVCIFENEEYFSYFHKLIQQFSFIDFNIKIYNGNNSQTLEKKTQDPTKTPTTTPTLPPPPPPLSSFQQVLEYKSKPLAPVRKTSRSSSIKKSNTVNLATTLTLTPSSSISSAISNLANYQNSPHTRSHSGFNLKNKIKSWFTANTNNHNTSTTSSNSSNTIISSVSSSNLQSNNNNNNNNNNNTNKRTSFSPGMCSTIRNYHNRSNHTTIVKSPAPIARGPRTFLKPPSSGSGSIKKTPPTTNTNTNQQQSMMKHSMSEPTAVNEFLK
jgi:hypothetical protein